MPGGPSSVIKRSPSPKRASIAASTSLRPRKRASGVWIAGLACGGAVFLACVMRARRSLGEKIRAAQSGGALGLADHARRSAGERGLFQERDDHRGIDRLDQV